MYTDKYKQISKQQYRDGWCGRQKVIQKEVIISLHIGQSVIMHNVRGDYYANALGL